MLAVKFPGRVALDQAIHYLCKGRDLGVQRLKTCPNLLIKQFKREFYTILFVFRIHMYFYFSCQLFLVGGYLKLRAWVVSVPVSQCLGLVEKTHAHSEEVNYNLSQCIWAKLIVTEFYKKQSWIWMSNDVLAQWGLTSSRIQIKLCQVRICSDCHSFSSEVLVMFRLVKSLLCNLSYY